MKLGRGISPRTATIGGILMLLLLLALHFYTQHSMQKFEASLPKPPQAQLVDASEPAVPFHTEEASPSYEETIFQETPLMAVSESEEPEQEAQSLAATASAGCGGEGCNHASTHTHSYGSDDAEEKGSELYAGLTEEAYLRLIAEIATLQSPHSEELLDKYEEFLIARFGPDPKIPKLIGYLETAHTLLELSRKAGATGYNVTEVDDFLNQLPVVVMSEMAEVGIELFNPTEERAAFVRQSLARLTSRVDTFKLLQETRPVVEAAIDAGEVSPEEGESFLKSMTGLNVTMDQADRTSSVDGAATPATIDWDVPEVSEY